MLCRKFTKSGKLQAYKVLPVTERNVTGLNLPNATVPSSLLFKYFTSCLLQVREICNDFRAARQKGSRSLANKIFSRLRMPQIKVRLLLFK
jgi:hypothetical protein